MTGYSLCEDTHSYRPVSKLPNLSAVYANLHLLRKTEPNLHTIPIKKAQAHHKGTFVLFFGRNATFTEGETRFGMRSIHQRRESDQKEKKDVRRIKTNTFLVGMQHSLKVKQDLVCEAYIEDGNLTKKEKKMFAGLRQTPFWSE